MSSENVDTIAAREVLAVTVSSSIFFFISPTARRAFADAPLPV